MIDEKVSYFHASVYNGIEDLAGTIMNPANFRYSRVTLSAKDKFNCAQTEHV